MVTKYRSIGRNTNVAIFFASLLMTVTLLGSVTEIFNHAAKPVTVVDQIEEIVVQG